VLVGALPRTRRSGAKAVNALDYKDYYAVLGVPKTASQTEIKKAYRKLAREHHPDAKPGDAAAERRFKDINEANAVLSDPDKRKQYDALGANWEAFSRAGAGASAGAGAAGSPFAGFAGFGSGGQGGNVRYEFRTSGDPGEFSDFFRMFFGGEGGLGDIATARSASGRAGGSAGAIDLEDFLAGMGAGAQTGRGRSSSSQARPAPPRSEAHADITLDEAFHGTTRLVDVDGKRLEITIPPGADTGTRIRLSGKGPGGGDLYVVVRQEPDRTFTRKGADLERELPVTLEEALLGAEVPVRSPKGTVLLRIPPGTQPGRQFRLRGRGLPKFRGEGHGDLYVRAKVVLPTDLNDDAKKAARRFLDLVDQPDPR
jgi:curved DNA-binding protein